MAKDDYNCHNSGTTRYAADAILPQPGHLSGAEPAIDVLILPRPKIKARGLWVKPRRI